MSHKENARRQGIALVAIAAMIWGWNGAASKDIILSTEVITFIFMRTVICVGVMTAFFAVFDRSVFRFSPREFCFLFFYGVCAVAGTMIGFFCSMQYLSISSTLLLHYTFPILTMVISSLALKESPSLIQILSAFVILFGVGLGILTSPGTTGQVLIPGILWGVLAVFGISMQTILGRFVSLKGKISQTALCYHGFVWSLLTEALYKTQTTGWQDVQCLQLRDWGYIAILSFTGTMLAQLLYFKGLAKITAPLGSLVSSLELVAASCFGFILFNEKPTPTEIIGSIIVVFAIAMSAYLPRRRDESLQNYTQ